MEIVNLAAPKFPLLLLCRDIIGYVKTQCNWHLREMTNHSIGLPVFSSHIDRSRYGRFPHDLITEHVVLGPSSHVAKWHKVFAALRALAGPVAVVEFNEFAALGGGGIPEIMRRVGAALFDNPSAWNGPVVESPIASQKNVFFMLSPPLRLTDAEGLSCSLRPKPREFWEFLRGNADLAAAWYPPEAIGWQIGDFKGDLGFVCDENEMATSGLPREDFVHRAGTLLETDDRQELLEYVRELNAIAARADELFAQVQVSPEQIIEMIRQLDLPVIERYREVIRSQAEELASVGVDVTDRWTHARELLGPEGFSRPPEQRYSHLREMIGDLIKQQANHLEANIDHLLAEHGRLAFWGLGNYFRTNVPSRLSDRPGVFLVDRDNRDSFGHKRGQSPEVLAKEKVGLVIVSAAPDSDPYWRISRDIAAGYPDAEMRSLGYLLRNLP
jgi:hypothetical protein